MIEDKIALALKDLSKLKEELRDIKKDMKAEEKIDEERYLELKIAYKDLRGQLKEIEDDHESELKSDEFYNKLRELRLKKEEDLAHANKTLFDLISKLPAKAFQMKMETEAGPVSVNIQPEMKLYVNGKEEKKTSA
jgi:hypothetical protein